jgi:hypothetical protein
MTRKHSTRIWLTLAVTTAASLALVSSASAVVYAGDGGGPVGNSQTHAAAAASGGLNWPLVAIGVAAALAAVAVLYSAGARAWNRNRGRLAPSH